MLGKTPDFAKWMWVGDLPQCSYSGLCFTSSYLTRNEHFNLWLIHRLKPSTVMERAYILLLQSQNIFLENKFIAKN